MDYRFLKEGTILPIFIPYSTQNSTLIILVRITSEFLFVLDALNSNSHIHQARLGSEFRQVK